MTPSTSPTEIRKVLVLLCQQYPYWAKERGEHLDEGFAIYDMLLADISASVLSVAAFQHIAQSRFFPTVAELREIARLITQPPRLTALEAWDAKNPLALEILRLLPNYNARDITLREQAEIRRQFVRAYEQIMARKEQEEKLLPGLLDLREQLRLTGNSEAA